jgi:hypothetical protein
LAFSYWIDNLGFITEGKLAAVLIKPSLGVSNWPVIYFINYTPTSSLALFITAPSKAITRHEAERRGGARWVAERRRGARRGRRSYTRAVNIPDGWVHTRVAFNSARSSRRGKFGVQDDAKARAWQKI